jgi:hypothetical protein
MGYETKNRFLELSMEIDWAMSYKMVIFKASFSGPSSPPTRESIPPGIDSVESMPGVLKSLQILTLLVNVSGPRQRRGQGARIKKEGHALLLSLALPPNPKHETYPITFLHHMAPLSSSSSLRVVAGRGFALSLANTLVGGGKASSTTGKSVVLFNYCCSMRGGGRS